MGQTLLSCSAGREVSFLFKKVLFNIIGSVSVILGVYCIFDRKMAIVLCGIGLLLYGLGSFMRWGERKKAGAAGRWALSAAIVSITFGVFILIGSRLGLFAERILLISISVWLIAEGILEILGAVMYRKAMTTEDLGVIAPGSVSSIVLGGVMAALGVLGLIFPIVAQFFVWIWIVCVMILSGIRMIWTSRAAGFLGESNG